MIKVEISWETREIYGDQGTQVSWQWCMDNLGLPGQRSQDFRWQWDTLQTFYFTNEADAVMFSLKWL